jgi:hypothetical protein
VASIPVGETIFGPFTIPNGRSRIGIDLEIDGWADMPRAGVVLQIALELSFDAGVSWLPAAVFRYEAGGGINPRTGLPIKGPHPRFSYNDAQGSPIPFPNGTRGRAIVTSAQAMTGNGTIETI